MDLQAARVVIVGGGFGGLRAALTLSKQLKGRVIVTLLSDTETFSYHAFYYKVLTGKPLACTQILLSDILHGSGVRLTIDSFTDVDFLYQKVIGRSGTEYPFDFLIFAMGSETIPQPNHFSNTAIYPFKTINDAITVHTAIHTTAQQIAEHSQQGQSQKVELLVVGAGPAGVEVAGELSGYTKSLAQHHKIDPAIFSVTLLEMQPTILPFLPDSVSKAISKRLTDLGVVVKTHTTLDQYIAADNTQTIRIVMYTVGVKAPKIIDSMNFPQGKGGKIVVDEFLRLNGLDDTFAIGDIAQIKDSGLALSAVAQADYVANYLTNLCNRKTITPYKDHKWPVAIPIGPSWALVQLGSITLKGRLGYWARRIIDYKLLRTLLPKKAALAIIRFSDTVHETCPVCEAFNTKDSL